MNELKRLYYEYISMTPEYSALGTMPEVKQAEEDAYTLLADANQLNVEEALTAVGAANEMQGWVYGFQDAMRMAAACGVKGGIEHEGNN